MKTRTIITRVMEFDAGHMLKSHLGFCKHAHGHRYRLEVSVQGEIQEEGCETGMVKDFSFIKKMLMDRVHAILDHSFMIEGNDPRILEMEKQEGKLVVFNFSPTVENIAVHIAQNMIGDMKGLYKVKLYETPNNWVEILID